MPGTIRYLHSAETGIELIFCTDWRISYPLHNHVSVFTMGIVLEGSLSLTVNHETKIYKKNQIFSIFPYVPHSISADDSYSLLSLCIPKNTLQQCSMEILKNNLEKILTTMQNMDSYQTAAVISHLDALQNISLLPDKNPFIGQLKKQLELHPEKECSVSSMAQQAFISKYHFIRNFKAAVGLTPHQFQIQNRIRKAQRFMGKTKTITEAALAAGFCDQSHFTKQFKKYVGLTPSNYKRSCHTLLENSSASFDS